MKAFEIDNSIGSTFNHFVFNLIEKVDIVACLEIEVKGFNCDAWRTIMEHVCQYSPCIITKPYDNGKCYSVESFDSSLVMGNLTRCKDFTLWDLNRLFCNFAFDDELLLVTTSNDAFTNLRKLKMVTGGKLYKRTKNYKYREI